jgi:hypothetical protein
MTRCWPALLLLAAANVIAGTGAPGVVAPFHAEYATLRDGDALGRTTLDLADNGDGTWTLRSRTRGTEGLAGLLGIEAVEESRFRWHDGKAEGIAYDYRQSGVGNRHRHIDFDAGAGTVRVVDGSKRREYPLVAGAIDRSAVMVAIADALARGSTAAGFEYAVAGRKRIEMQRFSAAARETLEVPAGRYEALRVARIDGGRNTTLWFSHATRWVPVQIRQTGGDGATLTLKLVGLTPD